MRKGFAILAMVAALLCCASCSNQIKQNAGTKTSPYSGVFSQGASLESNLSFMVWADPATPAETSFENGTLTITGTNEGYINNVFFYRHDDESRYFDFSSVAAMTFTVQGTIPLDRAIVSITALGSHGGDKTLAEWIRGESGDTTATTANDDGIADDPENGAAPVEDNPAIIDYEAGLPVKVMIDLSSLTEAARVRGEQPFVFRVGNDHGDPDGKDYEVGQYIKISEIDYVDAAGRHVDLQLKNISSSSGNYSNIFSNLKLDGAKIQLQAWEGTCSFELTRDGLKVYSSGASWFGGALVVTEGDYADLRGVKKITFEARGDMDASQVLAGMIMINNYATATLSTLEGAESFNEDTFTTFSIDIPDYNDIQGSHVTTLFRFSQGESYSGSGHWVEFRNIDFKDEGGNSVEIKLASQSASTGDLTDVFKNLDNDTTLNLEIWKDWEGNADARFTSEGIEILPTGAWAGGGITRYGGGKFDFSGISQVTFKIKGTVDPAGLKIYIQRNGYTAIDDTNLDEDGLPTTIDVPALSTPEGTLKDNGVTSISEDSWTTVTLNLSDELDAAEYALTFVTVNGEGDDRSLWAGRYFVISEVDYLDANGNSVALKHYN